MQRASIPHVRHHAEYMFVERVPSRWVRVCTQAGFDQMSDTDQGEALSWAIRDEGNPDFSWEEVLTTMVQ